MNHAGNLSPSSKGLCCCTSVWGRDERREEGREMPQGSEFTVRVAQLYTNAVLLQHVAEQRSTVLSGLRE